MIEYQRRLSTVKKKLQIEIADDASNYIELQNIRTSMFTECRDLILQMAMVRDEIHSEYYSYLREHASDFTERELPIYVKGDPEYQKIKRKKIAIELMIEEVYATQRFVETRSYDLKGALDSAKIIKQITSGK